MIKNCLKEEIKYMFMSGLLYKTLSVLILGFSIILFFNYSLTIDIHQEYKYQYEFQEDEVDIDSMDQEYSVEKENGLETITNPLAYYKDLLEHYIFSASPEYTISQLLEGSLILFPIIFGIYGLYMGSYDYKYKLTKIKCVRFSRLQYGISKQLGVFIGYTGVLVIGIIAGFILGQIMYFVLCQKVDVNQFVIKFLTKNNFLKIVFSYMIGLFYTEIGYILGFIFKNILAGTLMMIGYFYFIPNLGMFDIKNSIYSLADKVFDYYGVITLNEYFSISIIYSIFIIIVLFISIFLINFYVLKKRNMYQ